MRKNCLVPGRNFCVPNGKIAALFVDIDGTTLVCEPYFKAAKQRFAYYMERLGFDPARALDLAQKTELAYIKKHGFECDALARAMVRTYRQLCREKGLGVNQHDLGICHDIGRSPYFRTPELFPNSAAVLNRAHHSFRIIAVSIGNREAQKYKIRQAGLDTVFDDIIITQYDDKAELVASVIADLGIDPKLSAFIGNSLRSDGACLRVTNFIYLPMEPGWAFDKADLPKETGFETFETKDWREAEERGINRLLRRRHMNADTEPNHHCSKHSYVTPLPSAQMLTAKRPARGRQ